MDRDCKKKKLQGVVEIANHQIATGSGAHQVMLQIQDAQFQDAPSSSHYK